MTFFTVAYLGWNGIENGKLLAMAAQHGFDAVISNDRGLQYEQDVTSLPLPVVVILSPSNTIETLRRGIPDLLKLLLNLQSPGVYRIVID